MKIRKNDTVLVIAGKEKGKQGKVTQVLTAEHRVVVEGVNMIKRHTRPRPGLRQAGIVQREAPMHISNVVLICNKCSKPTRVRPSTLEDGRKVRVCLECKEAVD